MESTTNEVIQPTLVALRAQLEATYAVNRVDQGEDAILDPETVRVLSQMLTGDLGIAYRISERELRKIALVALRSHENLRATVQ